MDKENAIVLITGGSRGIGSEIARVYAQKGAKVMIADKDDLSGSENVKEIRDSGGIAEFCHADISVPSEISYLFTEILRIFGGVDILINNAGFGIKKKPDALTINEWDSVINTNLRGTFLCSREAAVIMRKRGGGTIINIASTRAFMSEEYSEAYAASKGGILALTHSLAASYAKDKIRVNSISPGWIETGNYEELRIIDHMQHFSGRVGKPSDIAKACIFLSDNDFINATNIIIDGGMTHKMIYEP